MSAQPKFTPGPWEVRTIDGSIGTVDAYSGRLAVAQAQSIGNSLADLEERRANAALIASAPELLEALRDVLDTRNAEAKAAMAYTRAHENFSDAGRERVSHERAMYAACEAEKKARAVIAKATGDKA